MNALALVAAAGVAAAVTGARLLFWVREGPPGDEGYLWYGALRTLAGEIPLRDFRSYEPGRYYWCALWMLAFGRGIVALRVATHAFFFLGLTCGLLALHLAGTGWPAIAAAAIVVAGWGYGSHKLFEPALSMFAVFAGTLLILHPGYWAVAVAGLVAGATSFFGVNYALYTGAGLFLLTVLEGLKSGLVGTPSAVGIFGGGAILGSLPLLAMLALVPGLREAFLDRRVRAVAARRTSNLPLPVPWPWRRATPATRTLGFVGRRFVGICFLLLPVFAWSVSAWAAAVPWSRLHTDAAVVAAAAVGSFSLHHAFSRADVGHLAQSIAPLVLGLTALLGHGVGWGVLCVVLGVGTLSASLPFHSGRYRLRDPNGWVRYDVRGTWLWLQQERATLLDTLSALVETRLRPAESLLAVPSLAELFPILGRRSAVYDTYCVYPATEREERRMLHSIDKEGVRLALVHDHPLDGREDLRFPHTHPLVWSHLRERFERLELPGLPPGLSVLVRDQPLDAGPQPLAPVRQARCIRPLAP